MTIKVVNQLRIFHNFMKKRIRLELSDCEIYNQMLYINFKLYVFDHFEFKIKVIKYIYEFLSSEYAKKLSTYDKMNYYYY